MSFELSCGESLIKDSIEEILIMEGLDGLKAKIIRKDGLSARVLPWDPRDTILMKKLGIKVVYPGEI